MKCLQKIIVSGYLLITLLIGDTAYTWHHEWQEVETQSYPSVRAHHSVRHLLEDKE